MVDRILVAFDESPQAHAALRHALSTYPDASIDVLHVNDPREWVYGDPMGGGYYSEEAYEQARESAETLLSTAEAMAAESDREVATATEMGQAATAIVDYAEGHDVDLVILGSHGRTGLSRFLLGSVAETVARRAPVSVTIIRDPDAESDA